jgi:hypothetical protein
MMNASTGGTYELDSEQIKLNAYRLACLFFANKEIARRSDPSSPDAPARLEQQFFTREMTHLLLQIAIALRVMDDQMLALAPNDAKRVGYVRRRDETNRRFSCVMFDTLTLRQVCNKIIHALIVEPHVTKADLSHDLDDRAAFYASPEDMEESGGVEWAPVEWRHLTGNIRLGGRDGKEEWFQLLEVPVFVEAITSLLLAK